MKDSEFLSWIWGRMVNVHGEQPNVDYMLRLNGIILAMKDNDSESDISFEQPKPRTKTEFVKCEFNHAWEAVKEHEENKNIYHCNEGGEYAICGYDMHIIGECANDGELYRKVETEIDERQEFIDTAKELIDGSKTAEYSLGAMFDSGKFKLVE